MPRYKKEYNGPKAIILLLSFVATVYYSFTGVNHFIHWLVSGFESHDLQMIAIIVLWLFSFGAVLAFSIYLGMGICWLVAKIFGWD